MRVIKRDGRTVDYDRNKILVAIRKANAEVDQFEKVSDDAIDGIIAGIEGMKRDTMQLDIFSMLMEPAPIIIAIAGTIRYSRT